MECQWKTAINWNAPFAYLAGSLQALSLSANTVDLASIKKVKIAKSIYSSSDKLVVRDNKVQLERKDKLGKTLYYNIRGAKMD